LTIPPPDPACAGGIGGLSVHADTGSSMQQALDSGAFERLGAPVLVN
jgi:hypothetical protein